MNLQTRTVIVSKSSKEIFDFLILLENYEQLMPENTDKFEIDGASFVFGLKGMPDIRLILKDKSAYSKVVLGAASSKMPFTLSANIESKSETSSEVQLIFEGEFNPMISMMVKKPLTKFIETLVDNIEKL